MTQTEQGWQPIETAPDDGTPHLRGLHVRFAPKGDPVRTFWACWYGSVDDYGVWVTIDGEHCGWEAEDFTHWMPLPPAPEETP